MQMQRYMSTTKRFNIHPKSSLQIKCTHLRQRKTKTQRLRLFFFLLEDIDFPLEILFVKSPRFAADTLLDGYLGAKEVTVEDAAKGA